MNLDGQVAKLADAQRSGRCGRKVMRVQIPPCPLHNLMENKKIKTIKTIKEAQLLVKDFTERNNWKDTPNIDKFDHLHEELIEMSQHLRYKSEDERIKLIQEKKDIFIDGVGDLFFGLCRLANQLGVDIEEAFNLVKTEILAKYKHKNPEDNITH